MTRCEGCDVPVTQPATGRRRRFCSGQCRIETRCRVDKARRHSGKATQPRHCENCESEIPAHMRADARTCSRRCQRALSYRRDGHTPVPPAEERFWSRVDKNGPGRCWLWTGAKLTSGYGSLRVNNRAVVVHRYSWELLRGPVPDGLQVDHICRVRSCCNPDHLEPVTQQENLRRAREANAALLTGQRPTTAQETTP